ncbi:LINE-1 retrotransposable element ORF2 protein [Eumeta japonica]|uniref:LINE-1 retrotransposable element ORF2 protein n=1 Tax=Eumeta variegata TaxID=151549 RepID=A0A4C1SYR0_EUMVA|nr:LINE-1 retrotransposable element ORF2 protein [Eumeta japonica]
MGDFNAQIGVQLPGEEYVIGKYGKGKRSKNGEKLVEFLLENNLTPLNTIFRKKPKNKWTWISPDGNTRNEIDYIITNKARSFKDTNIIQNLNFNTNHRMVRSCLNENVTKNPRPKTVNINYPPVKENTEDLMEAINSNMNINEKYKRIENKLNEYARKQIRKKNEPYLSEKTLELIEDRKNLIAKKNKKENQTKISKLSKEIRENMRKDKEIRRTKTLENHINRTGGTRKALKELREKGKEWITKLREKNLQTTSRSKIRNIATDYYRSLYHEPRQTTAKCLSTMEDNEDIPEILIPEVEKAIRSQKTEKAPGPDKITNELMRGTIKELSPILTKMFNETLNTGFIPSQWAESHIILLHKKGPKDDIGNYRPISLISNIYKVFAKVILDRISVRLEENQPVEQAGFRKDYSTIDHIHTIKQLLQKYHEYNKTIYLAFIDYSKAFDSLKHESVWQSLKEQGIRNAYINIIKNIYRESKACIRLESTGDVFPINRGVRQETHSPKLFTAVLEQMFRKLNWEHLGLIINGARLNHLRFADDLVIMEEDPLLLEFMTQSLVERSREVGLEINISKTKMMTNSVPVDITINGQKLEYVEEYVYLGQIISPNDQTSKEINKRIATGWNKYWALKEITKSKNYL